MEMVNYGLIGCGMMGREHIQNINLLPHGRVSVVFDPVRDLAESAAVLAGEGGASAPAQVADTFEDLLAFDELDAVVIVSPNYLHVAQLKQIVETRPMPILCEKPLYTDPADAAVLDALFEGYAHPVWVAMEYRYMPPVAALIEQAEQPQAGFPCSRSENIAFRFWKKSAIGTGLMRIQGAPWSKNAAISSI